MTARPPTDNSTFNVVIYGDLGNGKNSIDTIAQMNKLTSNDVDLIYHLGDISYADDDYLAISQATGFFYEEVYNKWMNSLAPVMSVIPYMVLVGNHEAECHSPVCQLSHTKKDMLSNYTAYNARFKMPYKESGGALNMWHSFDHGPIHFTSLSSETDYPNAPTNAYTLTNKNGGFGNQLSWVESELARADANRENVPWIIVGMHRPLYDVAGCDDNGVPTDQNAYVQSAFEALFIKYKVDVVLTGHKHYYERQLPIANSAAVLGGVSDDYKIYDNPQAPVYILTGATGNVEALTDAPTGTSPWNAAVDYEHYGYSTLEANRTTLLWKFILITLPVCTIGMNAFALKLLAAVAGIAAANVIVDDATCVRNKELDVCQPESLCEYDYNLGDLTFNQSCRVKEGVNFYPQQIHLAFAGKKTGTGMTVSWATYEEVRDSSVWLGESEDMLELVDTPVSSVSYYHDKAYNLFHHHLTLSDLTPRTKYFYKVGSRGDKKYTSDVYSFMTARPATDDSTFHVIVYGDLGDGENSVNTIAHLNKLTSSDVDLIYHLGDISYADDDFWVWPQNTGFFYEEVYNKWMNSLMPVMSSIPYMVLVGNHEAECHSPACIVSQKKKQALGNYKAYNTRFKMPYKESGGTLNMWHSFDHGPIHFTSLSSETDYPGAPTNQYLLSVKNGGFGDQLSWIETDLKKANANRKNVPWIIVGMHRPLYSVLNSENGVPTEQTASIQSAFEELFIKYKVDVVLTGHKHYYERELPIANSEAVMDGVSKDYKVYDNPQAPVHILTGGAGNVESMSEAPNNTAPWNAASDYEHFGYSTLEANRTTLLWKFILSTDQSVQDEFVMYKTDS
ncbi:hypothetical protein BBO99_00004222 [Phytophthora kernoviae]|uniref:Purple acid phosphatase n=1 Tax=Phytophthora kernoviae TaxID=325452 RepID=A0A421GS15_9STRA|nr:hypothetical protein JM16_004163 [Phytophthora kernoviae]RLN02038.1 hypothetical protein BBI17_004366 [Phytophthora kernoviae]RLN80809.1 hypothetical protein BBO99_00004222 [Phytophthora kernoviae]